VHSRYNIPSSTLTKCCIVHGNRELNLNLINIPKNPIFYVGDKTEL